MKESRVAEALTKQADTAVSFSELMVEICLPTQGSDPEDVMELERAEEDEDKGILVRATNLKDRAKRRGRRQLLTYRAVQGTVDMVRDFFILIFVLRNSFNLRILRLVSLV